MSEQNLIDGAPARTGAPDPRAPGLLHKLRFRFDPPYRRLCRDNARLAAENARLRAVSGPISRDAALRDIPYLAALNADLETLRDLPPTPLTEPGAQLAPGVAFQFAPEAGIRAEARGEDGFAVRLEDRGASPWFALSIRLPLGQKQIARWFGLRVSGASAHTVTAQAVIRAVRGADFAEIEIPAELVFAAAPGDNVAVVDVENAAELKDAEHADLLIFFRQASFDLRLSDISVFCAV